jgi:hypothetical protein
MSKTHAILSDIHRLLSTYDRDDFRRASKYPGLLDHIKEALTALAAETPQKSRSARRLESSLNASMPAASTKPASASEKERLALANSILRSDMGASISSLRGFATSKGFKLEFRPKESKDRLARRMAGALMTMPEARRSQVLAELLGKVSAQTQGWINVIKGSRL